MPKTVECRNGCGQLIWFDWNARAGEPGRSDRGKLIPLQVDEEGEMLNEKHNCPNSDYNKKQGQNNSSQSTKSVSSASNDNVGIKSALEHIADRLDNIVSWQKGIEEWQKGMTESQAKMVGFYADLVQVTRALRGSTVDPKEEELAQQEERYDQDKEDGLV